MPWPSETKFWKNARGRFAGRRLFLLRNSPSVLKAPLHLLRHEATMVFHGFHRLIAPRRWNPTFFLCHELSTCHDNSKEFTLFLQAVGHAFFPLPVGTYPQYLRNVASVVHLPKLPLNASQLDLSLEVAAYLGFTDVYVIGAEHIPQTRNPPDWDLSSGALPEFPLLWNTNRGRHGVPFIHSLFNTSQEEELLQLLEDVGHVPAFDFSRNGKSVFGNVPKIHKSTEWSADLDVALILSLDVRDEIFPSAVRSHHFYGPLSCGTSVAVIKTLNVAPL